MRKRNGEYPNPRGEGISLFGAIPKPRLDTRLLARLSSAPDMNLTGTTLVSTLAHASVVAVSVVSVSVVAVTQAPRGF